MFPQNDSKSPLDAGGVDSEGEEKIVEELIRKDNYLKTLAKSSAKTNQAIDRALSYFPAKWRNYIIRSIFSFVMVAGFCLIIYLGPLALISVVSVSTHLLLSIIISLQSVVKFTCSFCEVQGYALSVSHFH